jgi:hypothetical protein
VVHVAGSLKVKKHYEWALVGVGKTHHEGLLWSQALKSKKSS